MKIPLKGIFIGAKVVRGPDWEWGNQDGGRGTLNLESQVQTQSDLPFQLARN